MYRIKLILMLSTIIPSLDCCSSRTLFQRSSINLYRAVDLSMQKSAQFQQNDPQEPPPTTTLPPQLITAEEQTTPSYRHHHLHYDSDDDSDEDEEKIKFNRSQRTDSQNEEAQLEQMLEEKYVHDQSEQNTINVSTDVSVEDAQYKLIGEIVSIECIDPFRLEFCLNGGRCFLYPILNQSLSSCECAEGYVGERCEAKSFEFIPQIRPRFVLAKTIGGPLVVGLAVIDILFLLFLFCKNCMRDT